MGSSLFRHTPWGESWRPFTRRLGDSLRFQPHSPHGVWWNIGAVLVLLTSLATAQDKPNENLPRVQMATPFSAAAGSTIKVKVRGGFSLLDMKRFVETRGLKGAAYKGLSMEDLLTLQSPIVPIDFHGNPHFVVVRGLNTAGEVHLADPAFGNHAMSVAAFQSIWRDGIGFVVTQ